MSPIRLSIFRTGADANLRLRRISQKKVGERMAGTRTISSVGAVVGVDAACVVWKRRVETKVEEVGAELQAVATATDEDVIEELEVAVDTGRETRRRSNRTKGIAQRYLRVTHLSSIHGHTLEAILGGERVAGVGIALSAGDSQPPESKFID